MHVSQNLISGKRKYLLALILLFISVIGVAFGIREDDDFDIARREVLLRRIGHELLLQSGDSKSRVLPVNKIAADEYQIRFENNLTFQPDSLVNTTRRLLAKDPLAGDYVVNVLNCGNASVAYGFAISGNKKDDIVACSGRVQPAACYMINIRFEPKGLLIAKNGYLLGSLPFLAFVGFIFLRSVKPGRTLPDLQSSNTFSLGQVLFDAKNRNLLINGKTIDLTGTETRLLLIFASSPNETIERSRLQKEIWEDEGVIVGRSLDMFISKLRKKLELDPKVKIVVVRGKGYKLEIGS
ncbi:MAG: transcriptional regulator [Sphingobacteriales bacterium 17-39-43]|uniref:winged helix-turn-helix domain-containing protein n=1 Tax=Daejeonella sp. TaxID=2805397 RepID=UPI000BCF8A31|nr:winged helix-turn-helix domain-containing protein [Daejeonella sp.]OYX94672.1 MAG: transcriptional regulator [Sphingobacteriia bacterium 35-40-5]OYZ30441.1 MAG: transcriptional regulator [Sphingobacteriales bacterium 16-39-50]OZA22989.1 MAG: transcriptional regulator [Sphingobacteriales bacterium 17-39-43]OZA61584.1 MAG: transcriptional regulator [Sphingobacteriales bacterium 39-40-5]HQS50686.1 winged helix-turn-helix domain-containing protein [Daejeonella sp.]